MTQKKSNQPDVRDSPTLRTKQSDEMELLVAASEDASLCANWLFDQRIITQRPTS